MKKILIWVLFMPFYGAAQKFEAVFDFEVKSNYNKALDKFIRVDTNYWPTYIKKEGGGFNINGVVYDIVPQETTIDSFYLDDGEEKVYDIEYTCTLKNFDKFIVINIVSSEQTMYYFTISKMANGICVRKEYTNFEL